MNRFVESHLNRADNLHVGIEHLQHLVAGACRGEVGEYERVHVLAVETAEGILRVAQLAIERIAQLHLTVDGQFGVLSLHDFSGAAHLLCPVRGRATEVGVGNHGDDRCLVEEAHTRGRQLSDVHERLRVRVLVDHRVGNVQRALLRVDDVHRAEVFVLRTDADDLLGHLYRVAVFSVESRNEGISLPRLHHHHAEVVAFEHLVVGLLEGVAVACALLREDVSVAFASFLLVGVAQVDDFQSLDVEVQLLSHLRNHLVVAQQDGVADTFRLGLYGSFQHGGVYGFGKHDALRMSRGGGVELLCEFGLLSEQDRQRAFVFVPVGDGLPRHATLYGSLGHGGRNLGNQSWVNRFRDEVLTTEREVVHLIHVVDHIRHGLLGQVSNGVYGS